MSGFLPDLASWALGGGAGNTNEEDNNDNNEEGASDDPNQEQQQQQQQQQPQQQQDILTEEEVRARRLARMEAMQKQQQQQPSAPAPSKQEPEPMEISNPVDESNNNKDTPMMDVTTTPDKSPAEPADKPMMDAAAAKEQQPKKRKADGDDGGDGGGGDGGGGGGGGGGGAGGSDRKLQKKKELLLKKILGVCLKGGATSADNTTSVMVDVGDDRSITAQSIADILSTRISLSASAPELRSLPLQQKQLLTYLALCHRRAVEEIKTVSKQQQTKKAATTQQQREEFIEILNEIKRQVVNYASTCLTVPELFELGNDSRKQLATCLLNSVTDINNSITFNLSGKQSSFYYCLCEEILDTDKDAFEAIIKEVVTNFTDKLSKFESVLDGEGEASPLIVVTALTSLCGHKKAAEIVAGLPNFLLPKADTPEAQVVVRPQPQPIPPLPPGGGGNNADLLQRMIAAAQANAGRPPYLKRSGPALDKDTLLGSILRLGIPKKNNPSFTPTSILRQSLDSIERINKQQRNQLRIHQDAYYQFVFTLIKAGEPTRSKVMRWFVDALLVNVGASAMRPDPAKVSSKATLLNATVVLLKLCEPFINDEKKRHLIDAGFVSSPNDHLGVYITTGDDAVPRLGGSDDDDDDDDLYNDKPAKPTVEYNPKNKFVPQCFFLTGRFLHLGIVSLLSKHENLLRHISHTYGQLQAQNRDLSSEPRFAMLVCEQRVDEVSLFQEELVGDCLRYSNLMGRILFEMNDDALCTMPEHFVDDICDLVIGLAKMKGSALGGGGGDLEFRYTFKLIVKLLSAKYASMVRNYNLRAKLGDVLYELFLPSDDRSRDVPASVATDRLAGGQTYLLSDSTAQETLAPSLLLLYGEVEHTGYYDSMSHRAKISSLIKYLWESSEHRPAFKRITQNKESFIKFANGIMNETNTLIGTIMQKLPQIREAQNTMKDVQEWGRLSEEEQNMVQSRLDDNERDVKSALPLFNKTLEMFGYLNTDDDIRNLFLLDELCPRLVAMLVHVLTKLIGSKGLDLKVDNPEQYEFRPKEMLRNLCEIFARFTSASIFQLECARNGCNPELLTKAVKTCKRLNLLDDAMMKEFEALPLKVEQESKNVALDEQLYEDAPDEFKDEILDIFMKDPVILPSGHFVDRSTIKQQLLNDPIDPFSREPMSIDDVKPATELQEKMAVWLEKRRQELQQQQPK